MPNLQNIRVVDFSRLLPGPYCTMLLGDMGADVIKVESTLVGDPARLSPPFQAGESVPFSSVNRNKRSLAVNYRKPAGKELVRQLLATADVFVETFKPGHAARYELDYESVKGINPQIVYCALSGYGQSGLHAQRSGHDLNFMALAGMLDMLRAPDGRPTMPGFQLADVAGGSLFATIAILSALLERTFSGQGQYLDVSVWEGTASLMAIQYGPILAGLDESRIAEEYLAGALPGYGIYETEDGQYMSLAALEPVLWADFCRAVQREDLVSHQFPTDELRSWVIGEVAAIFRARTLAEWESMMAMLDLCCEPVLPLRRAARSMQDSFSHRLLHTARPGEDGLQQLASPRALIGDAPPARPAPKLGEHTVEVLQALGKTGQQIADLRSRKIVATPQDTTPRRLKALSGTGESTNPKA